MDGYEKQVCSPAQALGAIGVVAVSFVCWLMGAVGLGVFVLVAGGVGMVVWVAGSSVGRKPGGAELTRQEEQIADARQRGWADERIRRIRQAQRDGGWRAAQPIIDEWRRAELDA